MKTPLGWLCAGLLWLLPGALAIERLPVEDFAREPETTGARLAPDGRHYAFLRDDRGKTLLHVADVGGKGITRLRLDPAALMENAPKEVAAFAWVNADRLVVTTTVWDMLYGVMAISREGGRAVPISGYEDERILLQGSRLFAREIIHRSFDANGTVLMLDRHEGGPGNSRRPDVLSVDTRSGLSLKVVKNPGEVAYWGVDFNGVTRFGLLTHGDLSGAIYRPDAKSEWKTILPLQNRRGQMRIVGFDAANSRILVAMLNPEQRWAIYPLNPDTGEIGETLLSDPVYDIVPDRGITGAGGVDLAGTWFSRRKQTLAGVRHYAESLRVRWFDKEYAALQVAVDRALPNTVNLLVDESLDGQQLLWFGFSDRDPGSYYLFDRTKRTFRQLATRMSWIKPAQMAPMLAIKYPARDGLVVHGYLTVPVGHEPKQLPLVVLPHGGPWARDVWGFSPLVQLLANRGYAVLQVNYRGSTGYGDELFRSARRQIGGQIEQDIEDGTRWAVAAGIADPKRVAIVGASYGGYAALFALGRSPDLYRCGVSIAGVTDWLAIYEDSDATTYKEARRHWREQIGDPETDESRLRAISPVNFADQIKAPVLIIQGRQDKRVPLDQAKRMITALERAGRKPDSLLVSGMAHGMAPEAKRLEVFKAVVSFLERELGPGVD